MCYLLILDKTIGRCLNTFKPRLNGLLFHQKKKPPKPKKPKQQQPSFPPQKKPLKMATTGNHYIPPETRGQIILSQNMAAWLKSDNHTERCQWAVVWSTNSDSW